MAAACFPHSGDWLAALPNASCVLCIVNEGVRIAVGLQLNLDLCSPHMCQCGDAVNSDGHHGLVCRLSKDRPIRHHAINDIIWRSLPMASGPIVPHSSLSQMENTWPTILQWSTLLYCIILVTDSNLGRFCS